MDNIRRIEGLDDDGVIFEEIIDANQPDEGEPDKDYWRESVAYSIGPEPLCLEEADQDDHRDHHNLFCKKKAPYYQILKRLLP